MALDMAKYRNLFLEEAAEHLSEMSSSLLELEKDGGSIEAIDIVFRMVHSIKSMAASLGYDSISQLAHRLEDLMEGIRSAAQIESPEQLSLLFRGLEGLEQMVETVRADGEPPASADPALIAALSGKSPPAGDPKKKI